MQEALVELSGEYLYSIAAVFSAAAYILRSMLWLRVLLACAALTYIVSGVSLGITSMIRWNSAYLAINLFHIGYLLLDRVTITLPSEARAIYPRYFSSLSTREFRRLLLRNEFQLFQDQNIIDEYTVPERLYLILRGEVSIVRDREVIAVLKPGDFIGEMSFLSREPASATARADNLVQCAYWTREDLDRLGQRRPEGYNRFIAIVGCDLVRKLRHKTDRQIGMSAEVDLVI